MIFSPTQSILDLTWERNRRVITDATTIEYKLHKQFLIAQLHINDTPSSSSKYGSFKYSLSKASYTDLPDKTELFTIQNLPVYGDLSCTVEAAQFMGRKKTQEDAFVASSFEVTTPTGQKHTALLTGVFDGHSGDSAALFMKHNLQTKLEVIFTTLFNKTLSEDHPLKVLENEKTLSDTVIWNVLKITCVELHEQYPYYFSGTTAAFSLLIDGKDLWHANLGDSRSIVTSREKTIQLSQDMKIRFAFPAGMSKDEFTGIEHKELENPFSEYASNYPLKNHFERSAWKRGGSCYAGRFNGILAMARSIGDKKLEPGLCPRPKIVKIPLDTYFPNSDSVLLLHACDGLWDMATTDQVAHGINRDIDSSLAEVAVNLARSSIEIDGYDNTSVVLTKIDLRALREKKTKT